MSNVNVQIRLDIPGIEREIDEATDRAVFAMGEQALMDSNYYCKQEYGGLIAASLIHTNLTFEDCGVRDITSAMSDKEREALAQAQGSDLERGILCWDMPYAAKQYYLDNAANDPNENAQKEWFDKAKDLHFDNWLTAFETEFRRNG